MRKPDTKPSLFDRLIPRMPTREELAESKYLAPIAHRFLSPELWRFTRRSVPRGVALGLFAGFIIPLGQVFLAAFLALPARANVPLAALTTFVTNPLTLPFWLIAANRVGKSVLSIESPVSQATSDLASNTGVLAGWFEVAGITAVGFVVLSVVSAAVGYLVASAVWRLVVGRKRRRRLAAAQMRRALRQQEEAA